MTQPAAKGHQFGALGGVLDAFGYDVQAQRAGQGDHGPGEHTPAAVVAAELVDEGLVDLEDVDREVLKVGQAGVADAEVVDGDLQAEFFEGGDPFRDAGTVDDQHGFGQFEHQQ